MERQAASQEAESAWDEFDRPKAGQIFEHYKGGRYEIVATGLMEETLEPSVIYKSLKDGTVWVRTAANFFEDIESEGNQRPRFILTAPVSEHTDR